MIIITVNPINKRKDRNKERIKRYCPVIMIDPLYYILSSCHFASIFLLYIISISSFSLN